MALVVSNLDEVRAENTAAADATAAPQNVVVDEEEIEEENIKKNSRGVLPKIKALLGFRTYSRDDYLWEKLRSECGKPLDQILDFMLIKTKTEKFMWMFLWFELAGEEKSGGVDYNAFIKFFNIMEDDFTKRLFEIINSSYSGEITFTELLVFCGQYLLIDDRLTEEFGFRFLLRRAGTFQRVHSIMDLDDLKGIMTILYSFKNIQRRNKHAVVLFQYLDSDGDGGIDITEFHRLCKTNITLLTPGYFALHHFRQCLFGTKYWVQKSRKIAYHYGGAVAALSLPNRVNSTSEINCARLGAAVVSDDGEPIVNLKYDMQKEYYSKNRLKAQVKSKFLEKKAENDIPPPKRPLFHFARFPKREFSADFPEVEKARLLKKEAKLKEIQRMHDYITSCAVYGPLKKVVEDYVLGRRNVKKAFIRWFENTRLTMAEVRKIREAKVREAARLRALKFSLDEQVKLFDQIVEDSNRRHENAEEEDIDKYMEAENLKLHQSFVKPDRLSEIRFLLPLISTHHG